MQSLALTLVQITALTPQANPLIQCDVWRSPSKISYIRFSTGSEARRRAPKAQGGGRLPVGKLIMPMPSTGHATSSVTIHANRTTDSFPDAQPHGIASPKTPCNSQRKPPQVGNSYRPSAPKALIPMIHVLARPLLQWGYRIQHPIAAIRRPSLDSDLASQ